MALGPSENVRCPAGIKYLRNLLQSIVKRRMVRDAGVESLYHAPGVTEERLSFVFNARWTNHESRHVAFGYMPAAKAAGHHRNTAIANHSSYPNDPATSVKGSRMS